MAMDDTRSMRECTHYWHDPDIAGVELLHARYITHAFTPHMHEGYAIGVIEQGAEQFRYRHELHIAPAGSLVVINPGEIHTGEAAISQGWVYRMIYPVAELAQHAASELVGRPRDVPFFPSPVINDPQLANLFVRMHTSFEIADTSLERTSRLLWLLAHLVQRHADDSPLPRAAVPEHQAVRRVRNYLEQHYAQHIALDDLAVVARLSPFHLLRVFRSKVGLPPHAYLTYVRVRQAQRLLLADLPIADVAAQTGFADQSHLTRHFKRIVGVPPGHYRQNRKNVQDSTHETRYDGGYEISI
jgi:AraC-like DNA-binding protein